MAAQFVTQMAAAIIETSPIDQFSEEQRHIPQKIIRFASQVMVKTTESYDAWTIVITWPLRLQLHLLPLSSFDRLLSLSLLCLRQLPHQQEAARELCASS
jgi:hypothetical protein